MTDSADDAARESGREETGFLIPDERWPPITVIVRGLMTVAAGLGTVWWAWPDPTDNGAMVIFVCAGLLLAFGGALMLAYGIVRVGQEIRGQRR
ncbi:hypothetical protein F0U44_18180 [Nocardioides humilatus]|uniref:Uncharacterized protein n=1 Tax=Nocardioides humilatus TaxID=2607660 RepID=A0A5B1L8Q0_9ACTN|nr:hypothetical protein [Nocardioides humilatus]KAA1417101.1 hypothetical protein F0U44_18180 [Nocardioides humilatus]